MFLISAEINTDYEVLEVRGREKAKKLLTNLGAVSGAKVRVVSEMNGNLIIILQGVRLALSRELAQKIVVSELQ